VEKTLNAMQGAQAVVKSANSYYLDGKTHPNYAFSRIAFSCG
jgi:hypothetical protein